MNVMHQSVPCSSHTRIHHLVMSYSILLWIRDTAIRIQSERNEYQSSLVNSIGNLNERAPIMTPNRPKENPWEMEIGNEKEDLTWLLG